MIGYFQAERFVTRGDRVLRAVRCERCDCEYYYELARLGIGKAIAPYGLGSHVLEESATAHAENDLAERLATEAELVPCPDCHWINEELVEGFREGRYRWVSKWSVIVLIGGTVLSPITGCVLWNGPPNDHHLVMPVVTLGPVISLAAALLMSCIRVFFQRRIRPNANYPDRPVLPPGTPPALIVNSANELVPVSSAPLAPDDEWQTIQLGAAYFPRRCIECLAETTAPKTDYELMLTDEIAIKLPRCAECTRRSDRRGEKIGCVGTLLPTLIIPSVLSQFGKLDRTGFWIMTVFMFLVSLIGMFIVCANITNPVSVRILDSARGVFRIRFPNIGYRVERATGAEEKSDHMASGDTQAD